MSEGTTGGGTADDDPASAERDVAEARERLTGIVSELDRRRHRAFDLRTQLRRHGVAIGVSAGALVLLLGGGTWLTVWLEARRMRPLSRAHRLRLALARAIARPEDVARPGPNIGKKVLAAVVSAAAGVLAERLVRRSRMAVH